jgi:hypothetical protein
MTPQQVVGLAVRLFAVWMLTLVIKTIATGLALNDQPGIESGNASFIIAAVLLAFAIVLWVFPLSIAHKLIPRTKFDNVMKLPAQEVVVVSCIVMGLGLFVMSVLPALSYYLSLAIALVHSGTPLANTDEFHFLNIGPILLKLIVCAVLCFKAHTISRFFLTERTAVEHDDADS